MKIGIETQLKLDTFVPRPYQLPMITAIESGKFKRVLAILPRRAGKDVAAFNLMLRQALRKVGVYYYIFPTFTQAKRVIWDSILNSGRRFLDFIPKELIEAENSSELKIKLRNGSLIQLVGSDNFNCYDEKTEILTDDGWKLFKHLNPIDHVASLEDGYLRYVQPTAYMSYEYDGELYCASTNSMDFAVTPNHRFYVKSRNNVYKFKTIDDPTIAFDVIPAGCLWKGETPKDILGFDPVDFMAFLGIFLCRGSVFRHDTTHSYRITISYIPSSSDVMRELFQKMNLDFNEAYDLFYIYNKELYEYCDDFLSQKYIPPYIKSLNKELLQVLFNWIMRSECNRSRGYFVTHSYLFADDMQEIAIKLGFSSQVSLIKYNSHPLPSCSYECTNCAMKPRYRVGIRRAENKSLCGPSGTRYIFKKQYKGMVYCVSVPSGIIKVRRNGKEMWCGNSLMGTNPVGCVFSEYALQDERVYTFLRPILVANGGWAVFISTPRGKNFLYELYNIALQSDDWFCYKLTVEDTKHIPLVEIEKERAEGLISEDMIQQEYYTSFSAGIEGSYYAKYVDKIRLEGRIGDVPWEVAYKVNTAWDLGVRDSCCIVFFQVVGQTIRIIDEYVNSKVGLEHYVQVIDNKPYKYGKHIAPHDIKVQEFGSGLTRLEKARQLGIDFVVAPDLSVVDGIEAVRSTLGKVWIDRKCISIIKALENYRQEYDPKKKIYKNHPLHDQYSHMADAIRYLCISLPKTRDGMSAGDLEKLYYETVYGTNNALPRFFQDPMQ